MGTVAKVFRNKRSQLVRIPKEFQMPGGVAYVRRQGEDLVLSARPTDWEGFLGTEATASNWFLTGVADGWEEA